MRLRALSLIEVSICLIIMSTVAIASTQLSRAMIIRFARQKDELRHRLILKASMMYLSRYGRLPLAASDFDTGIANQASGYVPWSTLGIAKNNCVDAQNRPILYIVDERFTVLALKTIDELEMLPSTEEVACFAYIPNLIESQIKLPGVELRNFPIYKVLTGHKYTTSHLTSQGKTIQGIGEQIGTISGRPIIQQSDVVHDCIILVIATGQTRLSTQIDPEQYKNISYVTRFNAALYGGPVCRPFLLNKYKLLTIEGQAQAMKEHNLTYRTVASGGKTLLLHTVIVE